MTKKYLPKGIEAETFRHEGISKAEEICKKHRRDGRFFDEILEGGSRS